MPESPKEARYRANLQGEVDGAHLYRTLAEVEPNPRIAEIYGRLAAVEEGHAQVWKKQIEALGKRVIEPRVSWRTGALAFLARRFGPGFVLPVINTLEQVDSGEYSRQPEAVAAGLPQAERSHARILETIAGRPSVGVPGAVLGRIEGRHRSGGNELRAAVLGANDGLVSNLSLVTGVAGAVVDTHTLLITGLAGLVAGACSMAMGEWLSVNSARELYQKQINTEAAELEQSPDEEKEEIILIYQAKAYRSRRRARSPANSCRTRRRPSTLWSVKSWASIRMTWAAQPGERQALPSAVCNRRNLSHHRFLVPDGDSCDHRRHRFELCRPVCDRRRYKPVYRPRCCIFWASPNRNRAWRCRYYFRNRPFDWCQSRRVGARPPLTATIPQLTECQ